MATQAQYPATVVVRVSNETRDALSALAARRGALPSEIARQVLERAVADAAANDALGPVRGVVRKEVRAEIKRLRQMMAAQGRLLQTTAIAAARTWLHTNSSWVQHMRDAGYSEDQIADAAQTLFRKAMDSLHIEEDLPSEEDDDTL